MIRSAKFAVFVLHNNTNYERRFFYLLPQNNKECNAGITPGEKKIIKIAKII
jgi:hypothetical protein